MELPPIHTCLPLQIVFKSYGFRFKIFIKGLSSQIFPKTGSLKSSKRCGHISFVVAKKNMKVIISYNTVIMGRSLMTLMAYGLGGFGLYTA